MLGSPINLLLICALVGVLLTWGRRARLGRGIALVALVVLFLAALSPLGQALDGPLENRFPQPPADMAPPDGIIVLGGAINDPVSAARGQTVFDEGGERMTEAVILAKRYPQARVIYTGGSGSLTGGPPSTEALRPSTTASCFA